MDEIERLRRLPDPLARGRRAGELLVAYQQRANELARIRREAIDAAHTQLSLSFTDIAEQLGLTKGRISQIRSSAPPAERAFFGIGPVTVLLPDRPGGEGRHFGVVASEDDEASDRVRGLLNDLHLQARRGKVSPRTEELAAGDTVLICGPKSAPVAAELIREDPKVSMVEYGGKWAISDLYAGTEYVSPLDDIVPDDADLAYIGRRKTPDGVVVHIAGLHAVGSLGAVTYLSEQVHDLYEQLGDVSFSMIVGCRFKDLEIISTEVVAGPYPR